MTNTRIAVVIASLGRPAELGQLIDHLLRQTLPPSKIILSVTSPHDLPQPLAKEVTVVEGSKGLPAQRNRGLLAVLGTCDLIAFLDDDYIPCRTALEGAANLFAKHPDIVGANGKLLADGINTPGISYREALRLIERHDETPAGDTWIRTLRRRLYGCNMIYRETAISDTRFDENLPLYGWQEDVDFAAQMTRRGRIVQSSAFAGVHRGVKGGRMRELRFGYSQIANPVYLSRKGTMTWPYALQLMMRNFVANHAKALWPEHWVDRKGRMRGNWLAISDLMSGRIDPKRALTVRES